ncbi:hypothetical protein KUM39_12385 [Streptomyces sp. J2-1]|nr:hypothetical protein [Streptomyces corallincola]
MRLGKALASGIAEERTPAGEPGEAVRPVEGVTERPIGRVGAEVVPAEPTPAGLLREEVPTAR